MLLDARRRISSCTRNVGIHIGIISVVLYLKSHNDLENIEYTDILYYIEFGFEKCHRWSLITILSRLMVEQKEET